MFRCNHVCKKVMGYGDVKWVLRGQFISSNYKLAEAWGWSESSVRKFIKLLISESMVMTSLHSKFTLYEVTNYCAYQSIDTSDSQPIAHAQKTRKKRTANAQRTPNNNDNNDKELKEGIYLRVQHLSITKTDYDKLVSEYGSEIVDNKIEYAKNYAKLKNYKSLYLTLNNWLKSDGKKQQQTEKVSFMDLV